MTPTDISGEAEGLDAVAVVIVGRFNPAIFSPAWLRLHNLIGEEEAAEAKVQYIVPPAASFSTNWLNVNVEEERLSLGTVVSHDFERLRDTAVGVLTVLNQTPVAAMGINRECHWRVDSPERFHEFGDFLAPKAFWSDRLALPGTQDLTIESVRRDEWQGVVRVTVQPSVRIETGVYARVNQHLDLHKVDRQPEQRKDFELQEFRRVPPEPSSDNVPLALEVLRQHWDRIADENEQIVTDLRLLSQRGAE